MTGRTEEDNGQEDRAQTPWPLDLHILLVGNRALRDLLVAGVYMLSGHECPCMWSSGVSLSIF